MKTLLRLISIICLLALLGDQAYSKMWRDSATITIKNLRGREYEYAYKVATARFYRTSTWPAYTYAVNTTGEVLLRPGVGPDLYVRSDDFREIMREIFDSTFTAAEKALVKGEEIEVMIYFDTDGNTIGTSIEILILNSGWTSIPLEKLALFDENIMAKNFKFTVTPDGKKRNYLFTLWAITPK